MPCRRIGQHAGLFFGFGNQIDHGFDVGLGRICHQLLSKTIKLVGADHCVMSTDARMLVGSFYPHEQFRMFGERMQGYDISRKEVEIMMC